VIWLTVLVEYWQALLSRTQTYCRTSKRGYKREIRFVIPY